MFLYFLSLGEGRGLVRSDFYSWDEVHPDRLGHSTANRGVADPKASLTAAVSEVTRLTHNCPQWRADPRPPSHIHRDSTGRFQKQTEIWSGGFDPPSSSLDLSASAVSRKPPPHLSECSGNATGPISDDILYSASRIQTRQNSAGPRAAWLHPYEPFCCFPYLDTCCLLPSM